jgi:hypothetical protein
MSNNRQDIKAAIKTALQGNVPNVKSVFTARQRLTPNSLTPVITIYLPDDKENQVSSPAPIGKRRKNYTALLEIIMIDANPLPETGEAIFDGILDDVDVVLRQNFNLGGVVDGSAIKDLETHVATPQMVEGNTIFRVGIKKFDMVLTIQGTGA